LTSTPAWALWLALFWAVRPVALAAPEVAPVWLELVASTRPATASSAVDPSAALKPVWPVAMPASETLFSLTFAAETGALPPPVTIPATWLLARPVCASAPVEVTSPLLVEVVDWLVVFGAGVLVAVGT
jgi:hypothetical protein